MQPIHALLARMRWDAEFSRSEFAIGYWDRVARRVVRIGLGELARDADNPALFDIVDGEGIRRSIPLHRIREVWRDGKLIWERGGAMPGRTAREKD